MKGSLGGALLATLVALTLASSAHAALPDSRGYELVSPADKNGAQIDLPETLFGGGAFQAAAQGGAVTYTSASSFAGGQGSPGASQYLARRGAGGWSTENLTVTQFSGGYDTSPGAGAPYRLFSSDLGLALLTNGRRCRGEGMDCPVANLPLSGSGAPAGYRNYYLRDNSSSTYTALLSSAELTGLALGPEEFEVEFVAATQDLSQVVLSTCAALTTDALEEPGVGGECDPAAQNLYLRSGSGVLRLINLLPGETQGTPGAELAAQSGAISTDGSRVYFTAEPVPGERNLYLREGNVTKQVDGAQGGGGIFQTASTDGTVAFFTVGAGLYRYDALAPTSQLLGAGVEGALGASPDGSTLYYLGGEDLYRWHGGTSAKIATSSVGGAAAAESDYPPATGTARVSADGSELAFLSAAKLTAFDPKGATELYLYATTSGLACVSCNTTATKPLGPTSIPGAVANGAGLRTYRPRALSDSGDRLYFTTKDALVSGDSNGVSDVYQWEAQGTGSCATQGGCIALISGGKAEGGAFIDASADGADVFFTTEASLVPGDPGGLDIYDARAGGGFPVPLTPIPCVGDACQPLPGEPEDPTPGTLLQAGGNEPLPRSKAAKCKQGQVKKKGKCVKEKRHGAKRRARGAR